MDNHLKKMKILPHIISQCQDQRIKNVKTELKVWRDGASWKADNRKLIPRTHIVEGENQVVSMCVPWRTHTQMHTHTHEHTTHTVLLRAEVLRITHRVEWTTEASLEWDPVSKSQMKIKSKTNNVCVFWNRDPMSRMGHFYYKFVENAGLNNFISIGVRSNLQTRNVVCDSVHWASMSVLKPQNYQIDK